MLSFSMEFSVLPPSRPSYPRTLIHNSSPRSCAGTDVFDALRPASPGWERTRSVPECVPAREHGDEATAGGKGGNATAGWLSPCLAGTRRAGRPPLRGGESRHGVAGYVLTAALRRCN